MASSLFTDDSYELVAANTRLCLAPFPASEANALGQAFAAMDPWASYGYPADAIASYLAGDERDGVRLVLRVDGEVAGALGLQTAWLRGPYIRFLAILPAYQGRGLGTAILTWIEDEARKAEQRNVWVIASQINTGAIRFYERHGFTQTAQLDGLAYDDRIEILMRKQLAGA